MKKTLIALAALAATGASFAQVTLYGTVDTSLNYASSGALTKTFVAQSSNASSKLGFTGVEDLGGGMKAVFKLEGGVNSDNGTGKATSTNNQSADIVSGGLTFQRYSYVGLAGNFGEIRLGRDYQTAFQDVQGATDPFGTNGPANLQNLTTKLGNGVNSAQASNAVGYISPVMGGATFKGQVWQGENTQGPGATTAGDGYAVSVKYAAGPIFIAVGAQQTNGGAGAANTADFTLTAFTGSYDFGMAKVNYTFSQEDFKTAAAQKNVANQLGVTVPMGAILIKGSYVNAVRSTGGVAIDQKADMLGLGVDYNLSKRTAIYAQYANVKNTDGSSYSSASYGVMEAKNGATSDAYAFGIKHAF